MCIDFSQIKELIALVQNSNIGELNLKQKGFSLSIRTDKFVGEQPATFAHTAATIQSAQATPQNSPAIAKAEHSAPVVEAKPAEKAPAANKYVEIKSPMVGTFYRSASPDKPAFIKVGDIIAVDSPICLIEAMKLFNEVRAEISGKIVKVLVENATPVEYDQPLFWVEPA
jgi:acetyl-CoA carboxylase biotin carboxyl carrier protein